MNASSPKNKLLNSIWIALGAKRKSLRHRGEFEIQLGADEKSEWLRATFKRASGPVIVIELIDSGVANVYLQSARKADRNKVLFRREGFRVVGNAIRVCDAILRTFEIAEYSDESHSALDATWTTCSISTTRA